MKYYSFLFCMILFSACDPVEIERSLPDGSTRLCINSHFAADSIWIVNITRGKYILRPDPGFVSDYFEGIDNATVTIWKDGQLLTALEHSEQMPSQLGSINKGWYKSTSHVSVAGENYEIKVSAPGFESINASCNVPVPVKISGANLISKYPDDAAPDYADKVNLEVYFTDPAESENYYEMALRTISKYPDNPEFFMESFDGVLNTEDPLFYYSPDSFDPLEASAGSYPVLFSDEGMNGQEVRVKCSAIINRNPFPGSERSFEVILRAVSADYYHYKTTKAFQRTTRNDPFGQPVQVYTNVENGFGIFAGWSTDRMAFELN
jgi:hypothetical protein